MYKFSYQDIFAKGNIQYQTIQNWADRVDQRTNGRIKITVHPLGELGYQGAEVFRAVRDGMLQGATMPTGFIYGDEPRVGVLSVFGISAGVEEDKRAADALYPELDKILQQKWNQTLIADWIAADFLNAKREIVTLEDWKGLKVRTWDALHIKALEAIGAAPTIIPTADIYMSLATGVIDANIASCATIQRDKAYEVAKYADMWAVCLVPNLATANKAWVDSLPKDLRDIFMEESATLRKDMWQVKYYNDFALMPSLKEKGLIEISPNAGEQARFNDATLPAGSADFIKNAGADGQRLIDLVRAAQQQK